MARAWPSTLSGARRGVETDLLKPGDIVDRFEVEGLLGEGGLARVYLVRHRTLGARMALKVLSLKGSALGRRLLREGRIQANLSHPHIVAVSDVLEHEGCTALVMEYVEGLTLGDFLGRNGAMSESDSLALFGQLLSALSAAHAVGVLHRDLKPANILLASTPTGTVSKITDFGIARLAMGEGGDTLQGDLIGTPGYMAPEQVTDPTAVDVRADIYSMGALLYCMVAGRPPFLPGPRMADTLRAAADGAFPPVRSLAPELSPAVAACIEACLAPDPADRPADTRALAERLFGEGSPAARAIVGAMSPSGGLDLSAPLSRPTLAPGSLSGERRSGSGGSPTAVPELESSELGSFGPAPSEPRSAAVPPAPAPAPKAASGPSLSTATQTGPATAAQPSLQPDHPAKPAGRSGLWLIGLGLAAAAVLGAVLVLSPEDQGVATAQIGVPNVASGGPAPVAPVAAPPVQPGAAPSVGAEAPVIAPSAAPAPTLGSPPAPAPVGAPTPRPASAPASSPSSSPAASPSPSPAPSPGSAPASPEEGPAAPPAPAPSPAPAPVAVEEVEEVVADVGLPPPAPPAVATIPQVAGAFAGKWQGRPIVIHLSQGGGGSLTGRVELSQGAAVRIIALTGKVDAQGALRLSEPNEGWMMAGKFQNGALEGTIMQDGMRNPASFTARRD